MKQQVVAWLAFILFHICGSERTYGPYSYLQPHFLSKYEQLREGCEWNLVPRKNVSLATHNCPGFVQECILEIEIAEGKSFIHIVRYGPFTTTGGLQEVNCRSDVGISHHKPRAYHMAGYVAAIDPFTADPIPFPPIHIHHFNTKNADFPAVPDEYLQYAPWMYFTQRYSTSGFMTESASANQCPSKDGGDSCFWFTVPQGYGRRTYDDNAISATFLHSQDVRSEGSLPLSHLIECAGLYIYDRSISTAESIDSEDISSETQTNARPPLKPVVESLMEIVGTDGPPYSYNLKEDTAMYQVVTYYFPVRTEWLGMRVHWHSWAGDEAWVIRGTQDDLGIPKHLQRPVQYEVRNEPMYQPIPVDNNDMKTFKKNLEEHLNNRLHIAVEKIKNKRRERSNTQQEFYDTDEPMHQEHRTLKQSLKGNESNQRRSGILQNQDSNNVKRIPSSNNAVARRLIVESDEVDPKNMMVDLLNQATSSTGGMEIAVSNLWTNSEESKKAEASEVTEQPSSTINDKKVSEQSNRYYIRKGSKKGKLQVDLLMSPEEKEAMKRAEEEKKKRDEEEKKRVEEEKKRAEEKRKHDEEEKKRLAEIEKKKHLKFELLIQGVQTAEEEEFRQRQALKKKQDEQIKEMRRKKEEEDFAAAKLAEEERRQSIQAKQQEEQERLATQALLDKLVASTDKEKQDKKISMFGFTTTGGAPSTIADNKESLTSKTSKKKQKSNRKSGIFGYLKSDTSTTDTTQKATPPSMKPTSAIEQHDQLFTITDNGHQAVSLVDQIKAAAKPAARISDIPIAKPHPLSHHYIPLITGTETPMVEHFYQPSILCKYYARSEYFSTKSIKALSKMERNGALSKRRQTQRDLHLRNNVNASLYPPNAIPPPPGEEIKRSHSSGNIRPLIMNNGSDSSGELNTFVYGRKRWSKVIDTPLDLTWTGTSTRIVPEEQQKRAKYDGVQPGTYYRMAVSSQTLGQTAYPHCDRFVVEAGQFITFIHFNEPRKKPDPDDSEHKFDATRLTRDQHSVLVGFTHTPDIPYIY